MKNLKTILKSSQRHWVGDAFFVSSVFSYAGMPKELSPFLLLDYAAPRDFPGDGKRRGVGAHPHKGFETVTIAYQGEVEHRDSSGGGGKIGPGDVQWMTAGDGIIHEEFHSGDFAKTGGPFEMVQLWVNLPAKYKSEAPHYQTIPAETIPTATLGDNQGTLRVIAGQYLDLNGPAETYTPIDLWDIRVAADLKTTLPVKNGHTPGLLVLNGAAKINDGDTQIAAGDFALFDSNREDIILETTEDSALLLMAGEPIDEPVVGQGPFVMNTREEIEEAFQQFRSGGMGRL